MIRTLLSLLMLAPLLAAAPFAQGASPESARATPPTAPAATVNLNTASLAELQTLPGIGAKTAERILQYRDMNGAFKKIEELMNIQGIGEKIFLKLRPQITVTPAAAGTPSQR
jgi:competence protein ComEA